MFGLPVEENHSARLGWRAIFTGGYVDIVPGRGSEFGDEKEIEALLDWVNSKITLPPPRGKKRPVKTTPWGRMCKEAPLELSQSDEKNLEWVSDDGTMVLRCNPRASYGYLYISLFKKAA